MANRLVKHLTTHNDKLGIDYVLQPGAHGYYTFSNPEGFTESRNTYLQYIKQAVETSPLRSLYPEWFQQLGQLTKDEYAGHYAPQPKPVHEIKNDTDFLARLEGLTDVVEQAAAQLPQVFPEEEAKFGQARLG